jgi:GH15 family glucan-1,4-alpha-glucosidase
VDLVALLAERDAALSSEHWRLVEKMVDAVASRWNEPDQGIWEIRGPGRHHVHSRTMCWLTVDRALAIAHYLGRQRNDWLQLRKQIAEDVLTNGYNAACGAFTAAYGMAEPDAATLWVGLSGLLRPDDERFVNTVNWIERKLRTGPTVYRYHYGDWLPGDEGGFHICTTWLIEAYCLIGRRAEAERLFEDYIALAGPTGLLSEEYDPHTGRALGNHPQAYSHLGLINAAVRLSCG